MSETIQGSKSSRYIKDPVPGIEDSSDLLTHQSVQNLWGGRGAADVLIHGLYKPSAVPMTIEAGSVRRKIKITAHGANEGDFIKISSGAVSGEEIAIVKIIDANWIVIAKEINASVGDSVVVLRPVTPSYNNDGSLNVSVVPSPLTYNRKAAGSTVATSVLEDLDTPSASKPLPVAIHSIDGAGITVNAGDLSVSTSHVNDSMSIGDGTTLVGVTLSNEFKVSDNTTHTSLTTLNAKDFATSAKQDTINTSINTLLKPADTLTKVTTVDTITNTVTVSGAVTANAGTNLNTSALALESGGNLASLNTKLPSQGQALEAASLPVVLPLSQITTLTPPSAITNYANETGGNLASIKTNTDKLDVNLSTLSLKNQFPTALGQTTKAGSLSVALASDMATQTAPLSTRLGDGVDYIVASALAAAQFTASTVTKMLHTAAIIMGWDGTNHREIAVTATGKVSVDSSQLPASLGAQATGSSLSVVPATSSTFTIVNKAITASYTENLALTTVVTHSAPANAIGCTFMADENNANNIRVKQGGAAASLTSGIPIQPGRDFEFKAGTDLSVISDNNGVAGASVKFYVQWWVQA